MTGNNLDDYFDKHHKVIETITDLAREHDKPITEIYAVYCAGLEYYRQQKEFIENECGFVNQQQVGLNIVNLYIQGISLDKIIEELESENKNDKQ